MAKLRAFAFATSAILVMIGGAGGLITAPTQEPQHAAAAHPAWSEIAWPFALDQWGRGRAFRCKAADCGSEVNLYLRAKIGFCNCVSAIDDEDVDRIGDFDLVGGESAALGPGRPIAVRFMQGRSRGYVLGGRHVAAKSALAIAFHDHCDMVIATAVIASTAPAAQEAGVLEFLNSDLVLRWTETTLGL